ncbi:SSI family serine proteinase inhibitor [Nonomuraea turkmeniaca]|nr:SSI family serine proteinase inhibitor [Nonomuraea turkmeniaca]
MNFGPAAARRTAALGICAAAILSAPFCSLPAGAAVAGAKLRITVTPDAGGGAYTMRLTCDPDRGSHPRPAPACDVLRSVDGHIEDLDVNPGPCTLIYLPVEVEVSGIWRGEPIEYQREFPNSCVMERTLGPLV